MFTDGDNEVWSFGEEAYEILVKFLHLREAMRDYIRNVMREAHEKGAPVMRAMFYEFPEDQNCWDLSDQYMFGSDVLAAPIAEKGASAAPFICLKEQPGRSLAAGRNTRAARRLRRMLPSISCLYF